MDECKSEAPASPYAPPHACRDGASENSSELDFGFVQHIYM